MSETDQYREELKKAYGGKANKTWAAKVDAMRPDQVTAIYIRLRSEGKLAK
jgi:hypothetical protein